LSTEFREANAFHRMMHRIVGLYVVSMPFSVILDRLDKLLYRLSRGRWTVSSVLAGLPLILLTTTGAKSGKPRRLPVLGLPYDDRLAVVGSNWGKSHHPAWSHNLWAHPEATVAVVGGSTWVVRARPATEQERKEIWEIAVRTYPGWAGYERRCISRAFPVFVLDPIEVNSATHVM
jgi:deazaflavin-dependent oxidoreductase (nitroreductase family)